VNPRLALPSIALLGSTLLILGVACNQASLPPAPDHPRLTLNVRIQDVTFHSVSLQRDMPYRIILPSTFPHDGKLPVVYLLHGGGGGYRDWSNYSDVSRFAESGLILVMPEGNSSYYMNARARPEDRYEDYITKDLISDVEARFPAASGRETRAILGVSMGGFGAVVLSFKHPDLYVFAGGLSPALDVPTRPFSFRRMSQYRAHTRIFGAWGTVTRRANDPYHLAETVDPERIPYLFLTCGQQEGLLPPNQRFAALLKKRGFKYEFHAGPGGHDWNQWNRRLPDLFESLRHHSKWFDHGH
jgi:putative tributyrin esterase